MSTTDGSGTPRNTRRGSSNAARAEPQAWRTPEDATGWTVVARGQRRPGGAAAPLVRVVVDLDAEQSDWLECEAERAGLGYGELMKLLVDEKRAATKPAAPPRNA